MPFRPLYTTDDLQSALDKIAIADGGAAGEMPISLGWSLASSSDRGRVERLRAQWQSLTLEDRISKVAVMIGGFVPGDASNPRHVITHGYEALCRIGSFSDEPEPVAA